METYKNWKSFQDIQQKVIPYLRHELIRAANTRYFVSVRELLDKLLDMGIVLHERDVNGIAGKQDERFPPVDDVVSEEDDQDNEDD